MYKITYCNVCGNELSPEDRFCNICGAVINAPVQSQSYIAENPVDEHISRDLSTAYPDNNVGYTSPDNSGYTSSDNSGCVPPDNVGYASPDYAEYTSPDYSESTSSDLTEHTSPKKHKRVIAGIVVLACLLAAGLGTWYFISHRDKDDSVDVKKINVIFDLEIFVKDDIDLSDVKVTAEKDDEVVELEISGNKAVAQLAPGKWKIKAEAPNYEPIIQEIKVLEDTTEAQEFTISFDFTEQPMVQSSALDTSEEVTTEAAVGENIDEPWRQAYIDYLADNNILNVRTIPMEMEYTPARSTTQDMLVYDDGIGKIYMNSMSLYDSNMDGVPELYYLWDFSDLNYFEFEDGSVEQCVNNYYRVVTRYSYDGIRVNSDSVSYVYEYLNGKSEVQIVDATGDISLTDIVIDKNPNVFEKGIDVYKENEDGTSADIDKVNYYIANYKRETKAEIDDSLPWRQAYIDYLKSLDLTDPSMYIEDEIFNIINESFFWCDFATYEFKLVDYDNNGIPELCLMKWWNGFELSGSIYQYEFVEYKEDGNLEIIHAAELYEYNSLDGECFVKTRGDKERLDHSLIDLFDEEGFSDSWYPLINNAPEYEFEYYFYDSTTSDLNPDAITYIENYGK